MHCNPSCLTSPRPLAPPHRFVVHRPSGQVVAERSLKEVPAAVTDLLGEGWSRSELLPLNPPEEEVQGLKEALLLKLQVRGGAGAEVQGAGAVRVASVAVCPYVRAGCPPCACMRCSLLAKAALVDWPLWGNAAGGPPTAAG